MSTIHTSRDADIGRLVEKNNTAAVLLTAQECFAKYLRIHSGAGDVTLPDSTSLKTELDARGTGQTTWCVHVFCDGNTTSQLNGATGVAITGSTQIVASNQAIWIFRWTAAETFLVHNRPF